MNVNEAKKVIAVMMMSYPNYNPIDIDTTAQLFSELLADYSYKQIDMALRAFISTDTSGFAPSIGQLIEQIQKIGTPDCLSEMQAWALVSDALRNSSCHAEEEFEKLPELVQRAVGSPNLLRSWATTDERSIENVVQSNFMRSYRAEVTRSKELQALPNDIKAIVQNLGKMRLIGGSEHHDCG